MNENRTIDPEESFYENMSNVVAAIQDGRYPAPPARNLYLISKGKPQNDLVNRFLIYILTEGQELTTRAGYVELDAKTMKVQRIKMGIEQENQADL